jgi:heparin binding hemagglutinin HbhA
MARTTSSTQTLLDPTRPFYAAVGGVDVAVAYARTGLTEAQTRFEQAQSRLSRVELEPKALPGKAQALVTELTGSVAGTVTGTVDDLTQQYADLAARGRTLVGRIRRQPSTQEVAADAKQTVSRAKTTRTQATKAARTTRSSAKATGTTARKTAGAATKATKDAAAKTGTGSRK